MGKTNSGTILVMLSAAAIAAAAMGQTPPSSAPAETPPPIGEASAVWRDKTKTPEQRARDLLPRLTLAEKIGLLHADGTFSTAGLPRFGIGKFWMDDGPQGVREEVGQGNFNAANRTDDFSTALPADIGLAATFDEGLANAYGNVIGQEAAARHKNCMLCPALNIMRTPLNGRNSEYMGEDPFLSSRMAVNFINGLQQNGVAACAKHYAFNNQENNRNSVNVHVDERTMHEIYLPAFKAAVTEAHVWSVMTAYNRVNGAYCSENDVLLNQILKKDWNFQGLVMTDWGGAHSTVPCANNGLDLEMGTNRGGSHNNDYLAAPLIAAINANEVPMARIDDMVLRNLRVMAATGLLNGGDAPASQPGGGLMSPAHTEAARKIEESAIVLLKNNNVLPLDAAKIRTIAVIGQNANTKFAHDGNSAQIKTSYEITPLEGITKRAGADIKVTYVQGYARAGGAGGRGRGAPPASAAAPADLVAPAVEAAKNADVVIVCAGLYRNQDQEGNDRPNMNLPAGQAELITAVTKANPKTIVILNGGSPSVVDPWLPDASALLMQWYGGTEGGNALARILFGDVNPSGHLPCSWPKQLADSPAHNPNDPAIFPGVNPAGAPAGARGGGRGPLTPDTGPQETYAEKLLVGYRWFDTKKLEPQFPFGFGLSYTTFQFSDLQFASLRIQNPAGGQLTTVQTPEVSFSLANTGQRAGAALAQVYIEPLKPSVDRPLKELKGFAKIALNPGEKKTASVPLPPAAFAYYSPEKHAWIAEAGDYIIHVGDSSRSLPLHQPFHLAETITIPEATQ